VKAAKRKILEIYESVEARSSEEVTCIRTTRAITIVSQFPQRYISTRSFLNCRHIQIILRLYSSPSEILSGFDVDACAVGYDGTQVYASPRAFISHITQTVTVDVAMQSASYEMRLIKYASRGFEIYVPNLRRDEISLAVLTSYMTL
jgi:hypothetical protein